MRNNLLKLVVLVFVFGSIVDIQAQRKKNKREQKKGQTATVAKPKPKPKPKKGAILPYDKVVTKEMKTDDGLLEEPSIGQHEWIKRDLM